MKRREFIKTSLVASSVLLSADIFADVTKQPIDARDVSKIVFPEKRPLIIHSDRPPLLESPRGVFTDAITPNDAFFVRWHSPKIVTHTEIEDYRITIKGLVENRLDISLKSLKNDYKQVELTAVLQCGGNSRSAFKPTTNGIQWGSGAMGCASWKGVRLKDVLDKAGLSKDARWINFNGSDKSAFYKAPNLVRELEIKEITDDIIIAYEMNGKELPFLNGYPVRLVIPGSYSDSWIKMLTEIEVTKEYKKLYYMDKGYRIPDNESESETPSHHASKTKPITTMNTKSIIGYPTSKTTIKVGKELVVKGVAFDAGHGIKDVFISLDEGKSWQKSKLNKEISSYAFREFNLSLKPKQKGKLTIMAKAINTLGEEQPFAKEILWNHGGYKYNGIDSVTIKVV